MKNKELARHTLSRRAFAQTLASGSLVAGFDASTRTHVAAAQDKTAADCAALPPLAGAVRTDESALRTYAQDHGQIIHQRPRAVLLPASVEDVVEMVHLARRSGLRIAARGQGHQPFGQAQVQGGVVIDMRSLQRVHSVTDARVDVDAGADWRTVLKATVSRTRTPPVMTNYLGLTVGGTLSIGGIGSTTLHHGAQVDQVRELEVVTGAGELLTCSDREHPDLFEAVLAGQGQCAIITRAVLDLIAAPRMLREYLFQYTALPALLQDQQAILQDGRFDGAVGLITASAQGWAYALQAVRHFTPPQLPDDAALAAGLHHVAGSMRTRDLNYLQHADELGDVPFAGSQPSLGLLLPGPAAAGFLGDALPRLTATELGAAAALRVFFWNCDVFTRPLFRVPETQTCAYVALLRAETEDPKVVARMLAGNRTLFEHNRTLGGALYPFSALALTRRDWRRHYAEAWRPMRDAKRRYDPGNVFASGPDLGSG